MTEEYEEWKAALAHAWAKEVSQSVRRLRSVEDRLDEAVRGHDLLHAVRYDGDGGSASPATGDEAMARAVIALDALKADFADAVEQYSADVRLFESCLRNVDALYDNVLHARYVRLLKWADIGRALHYDEDYLRSRLRVKALAALYDVMPHYLKVQIPDAED